MFLDCVNIQEGLGELEISSCSRCKLYFMIIIYHNKQNNKDQDKTKVVDNLDNIDIYCTNSLNMPDEIHVCIQ
ncbi:hypothetical protein SNEBB_001168 [Seison nebaliae]|nr:hypothetical protein SNEBB_001168 [Seison nebaliae]